MRASSSLRAERALPTPSVDRDRTSFAHGWGWTVYLAMAAVLTPVLQPTGPAQLTILDGLNLAAIAMFACAVLMGRMRLHLPMFLAVLVISVGSLVAVTNAESFSKCVVTLVQDAYLYLWFLLLVNVLKDRGIQRGVRLAWLWSANIAAVLSLGILLSGGLPFWRIFGPKGQRAVGLFDGPNSLADYLMMSLFVILSLAGQARRSLVWGSAALVLLALIATKSNGAILGLACGLAVWAAFLTFTRVRSMVVALAVSSCVACFAVFGWWATSEWNIGASSLETVRQHSFLARMERSTDSREQIWQRLKQLYDRHPLGIGPGNSSAQRLSLGQRERRRSYVSKEAHNDYLGYLVERGPLGLAGLVMMVAAPFVAVWLGFRKSADRRWTAGVGGVIAAALLGGLVATSAHSFVIEKLHFRHYWLFLAIVFAYRAAPVPRLAVKAKTSRFDPLARRRRVRPSAGPWQARPMNGVHPEFP